MEKYSDFSNYFAPVGVQSIVISGSVCLSVCLLVRSAYLNNHNIKFH